MKELVNNNKKLIPILYDSLKQNIHHSIFDTSLLKNYLKGNTDYHLFLEQIPITILLSHSYLYLDNNYIKSLLENSLKIHLSKISKIEEENEEKATISNLTSCILLFISMSTFDSISITKSTNNKLQTLFNLLKSIIIYAKQSSKGNYIIVPPKCIILI